MSTGVTVTRKLGLAAYIKMCGATLKKIDRAKGYYVFNDKSGKSIKQWEMEYMNSCCHRHDTELVNLRRLMREL